ncbi:adenylate/guanylate cyclase domain-containing protein [Hylemonella gracilis]|uniref:Adenylate cyclase protein n=1 Tax=Hylemonella gracilis ATCC 19624 TaxID=887062 RepID=F3KR76_9BURK|nr:adenylate/guanylate cyclase domain-containing protein [Hylemonella gracilis]EGI77777.1 adenylate cyclase protein [Hylemonella gracilis ATCC 19624]
MHPSSLEPGAPAARDTDLLPRPSNMGFVLTRLRLISGLTLFTFVITHLVNHALGLVSLEVMRAGQAIFILVWHSLPGSLLLTLAALTHLSLVLYKQVVRPTLRMPGVEGVRILLGIVTLLGLSLHATPMVLERLRWTGSGQPVSYPDFIGLLASGDPMLWNQLILVIAAWTHGCIGVHLWLRLRDWYRRRQILLAIVAVLVPLLALLGVLAAARALPQGDGAYGPQSASGYGAADGAYGNADVGAYGGGYGNVDGNVDGSADTGGGSSQGAYGGGYGGGDTSSAGGYSGSERSGYGNDAYGYGANARGAYADPGRPGAASWLGSLLPADAHSAQSVMAAYGVLGLLLLLIATRVGVRAWERRRGLVSVRYANGREVKAVRGASVLDISRMGGVPHASVCGGRGRCSTCRVHVDAGWEMLPPPLEGEQKVLQRIHAPTRVRLACQLCPRHDVAVTPLLPTDARPQDALPYDPMKFGVEQEIVILFADLRGFTQMSETKLPFDVVHILNQYFAEMGEAIESSGGHLDKFIGDGIMALFGLQHGDKGGVRNGARHAMAAARAMGERLTVLNTRLAQDLATPLRLGLGIHVGHVIIGEMGYGRATSLTAIGDSVNVASRLESATKEAGCELLISAEVAQRGELDLSAFPELDITVRGREGQLKVYAVQHASHLPRFQET